MAALLIVGALAIADKVERKKEKKREKKANDEKRYRELQLETNARITRRESAMSANNTAAAAAAAMSASGGVVIDNSAFVDEPADSSEDERENVKVAGSEVPPPAYEDAVQAGERREQEWKRQMERRRSSVYSERSGSGSGEGGSAQRYMRMG